MSQASVLLLDDSPAVHERVKRAFSGTSVKIEVTDSWVDAKAKLLGKSPPDLLILDLQMPSIDGRTFGRVIKRRLSLPIVVYSSETAQHIAEAMAHIGAEGGVSKSASDEELVKAVLEEIRRARAATSGAGAVGQQETRGAP